MIKRVFGTLALCLACCLSVAQQAATPQAFFPVGSSSLSTLQLTPGFADSVRAATAAGGKFTLWGVASPEGRYQSNVRLAQRRADAILREVVRQTGLPSSLFETRTRVMESTDLRHLVAQDAAMPSKDEVLQILDASESTPVALRRLKQLDGGTPYLYIKNHLFPYLRTSVAANTDSLVYRPSLTSGLQPVINKVIPAAPKRDAAVAQNTKVQPSSEIKASPAASLPDTSVTKTEPVPVETATVDTVAKTEPSSSEIVDASGQASSESLPAAAPPAPSVIPYWLAIIALLLLMAGIVVYYRRRVAVLDDELSSARLKLDLQKNEYEEKLAAEADKLAAESAKFAAETAKFADELEKAKDEGKSQAIAEARDEAKKNLYNDGETLCNHLLAGGSVKDWTTEQINSFITYYKVRNFALVNSLETEYDGLTPNQILFEILVNMDMTDADIQRVMGISQTTIRSNRFRIKSKKRS